ncbi:MAG: DinB family protein [Bryobacteraceae bacterium]
MATCRPGRPGISEIAPHAKVYVDLVPEGDIDDTLSLNLEETIRILDPVEDRYATEFAYAPGKWTIKQVIGHLIDTERIFAYRALRIARGDTTPLPGFEQDDYVKTAGSNGRPLTDLIAELRCVRQSTLMLLRAFPPEAWMRTGRVNDWNLSVRGIIFTTAGHELHHAAILRERYLQPVNWASA